METLQELHEVLIELEPYEIEPERMNTLAEALNSLYGIDAVPLEAPIRELSMAIGRAASELQGQGSKSDRIAQQLVSALARFYSDTGLP